MRGRLSLLTLAAALALLAGPFSTLALADSSGSNPAAKASLRMFVHYTYTVHGSVVTVPHRGFTVEGVVRPYVPGQWVTVRDFVGPRQFRRDRLRIKPSAGESYGAFTERVASPRPGIVRVRAEHTATAQLQGFFGRRAVDALSPAVRFGSTGRFVQLMQQRLAAVHVYLPQSGVYDAHMGLALDAYHRLLGRGTSKSLGGATISALLNGWGRFHVRHPGDGKHVEGNLGSQLLALIDGGRVYRIYPISSGKPSTPTILGHFRVYRRAPGFLPDGMYYSDFFSGGYAIHGYDPAPDFAASHGCMRLPIIDAISVYDWLNYGDVVDVYR
jgi:hypothetical protein